MERKQAKMADQSSDMVSLPSHLLMEIISRLPIKTVLVIKCVCKSLLSLVSDSDFQILHSARAPEELMLRDTDTGHHEDPFTTLCLAESFFVDDSLTTVEMDFHIVFQLPKFSVRSETVLNMKATKTKLTMVNACRGLVCFCGPHGNRFVVISNPFTGELITFPRPDKEDKTIEGRGISYGLGFSPKDNCFKLLRVLYRKNLDTDSVTGEARSKIVGEVYTFGGSGLWKRVANCSDVTDMPRPGAKMAIFHEGVLHWYCSSNGDIVTFDFDTELFGKLVTPSRFCGEPSFKTRWSSCIGVFGSCLYITGCVEDCVDIWLMKEYGRDSWIKAFSIPKDAERFSESYEPIKYLQNGEILMFQNFSSVVCYNPDTGSVKLADGLGARYEAIFIKPSLVSLEVSLGDNVKPHRVMPRIRRGAAAILPRDMEQENSDPTVCGPSREQEEGQSSSHAAAEEIVPWEDTVELMKKEISLLRRLNALLEIKEQNTQKQNGVLEVQLKACLDFFKTKFPDFPGIPQPPSSPPP